MTLRILISDISAYKDEEDVTIENQGRRPVRGEAGARGSRLGLNIFYLAFGKLNIPYCLGNCERKAPQ